MDVFQYEKEKYPCYKVWISITILVLVLLTVLFNNIDYEIVYKSNGIVIDVNTLKIYCSKDDLDKIVNNKNIIINNRKFAYKNIVINDIVYNQNYYFEVILNVEIDKSNNVKNNVIDFKIPIKKLTILEYILHKVGGE